MSTKPGGSGYTVIELFEDGAIDVGSPEDVFTLSDLFFDEFGECIHVTPIGSPGDDDLQVHVVVAACSDERLLAAQRQFIIGALAALRTKKVPT